MLLQGGSFGIGHRYGFEPNLPEGELQLRLEDLREQLKKEIRKEMKIKEGAEKLREATNDKKSISDVQIIVKKSNTKLKELQQELQELDLYLLLVNPGSVPHRDNTIGKRNNLSFNYFISCFSTP